MPKETESERSSSPCTSAGWIFVTVGTTRFDDLVEKVIADPFRELAAMKGFEKMIVQAGRSDLEWLKNRGKNSKCSGSGIFIGDDVFEQGPLHSSSEPARTRSSSGKMGTQGKTKLINVELYRFKPSLHEDMFSSSLVISHAGAGSCLEVLEIGSQGGASRDPESSKGQGTDLLVVVNDKLMDNHQLELAYHLSEEKYCWMSQNVTNLEKTFIHFCECKYEEDATLTEIEQKTSIHKKMKKDYKRPFPDPSTGMFAKFINHNIVL
eukprot:Nk52_evm77s210 gene=Nk52_evmTU77s210